ncbi:PREDICTED: uncharacterized protein At4g04775-like [Camelina sativa]|uniref:Uncharacterized protein At4g04775-like n=1 Tax=Camelina sativa TaxID=90675 RepID=A0ABM0URS6_CAMSA|nr:PREDICTED: uncharacterized protein At4g04775-like [Camelina sativa]
MSSSSASSGVSDRFTVIGRGIPRKCRCGRFSVMKTSNTMKNPGRLFHCCPNGSDENPSHLFKWTDISMVEEMEEFESVVDKIEREVGSLAKGLDELEAIKKIAERCEKEIVDLKGVVSSCEKEIQKLRCFKNMIVCGGLVMAFVYYVMFV